MSVDLLVSPVSNNASTTWEVSGANVTYPATAWLPTCATAQVLFCVCTMYLCVVTASDRVLCLYKGVGHGTVTTVLTVPLFAPRYPVNQ